MSRLSSDVECRKIVTNKIRKFSHRIINLESLTFEFKSGFHLSTAHGLTSEMIRNVNWALPQFLIILVVKTKVRIISNPTTILCLLVVIPPRILELSTAVGGKRGVRFAFIVYLLFWTNHFSFVIIIFYSTRLTAPLYM